MTTARTYRTAYELGARGRPHRTLAAAARDLRESRAAARKGGDSQGIRLVAVDGGAERDLRPSESVLLATYTRPA
jgi:hypothetical protein